MNVNNTKLEDVLSERSLGEVPITDELITGNWLLHKDNPKKIVLVTPDMLRFLGDGYISLRSIKLSEELLFHLGYEYYNGKTDGPLTYDALTFDVDWIDECIQIKSRYEPALHYKKLPHIKYLHQLQNFIKFFANQKFPLTNEL